MNYTSSIKGVVDKPVLLARSRKRAQEHPEGAFEATATAHERGPTGIVKATTRLPSPGLWAARSAFDRW